MAILAIADYPCRVWHKESVQFGLLCKKIPKSHLTQSLGFSLLFIDGQTLRIGTAHVYYEDEPGRRSAAKLLTRDGLAGNMAKLPELLQS
jgi:hypothetical protein